MASSESVFTKGEHHPARLTTREFQCLARIIKDLLAENPLVKAAIIAAGIGGALEGLHILWLVVRFMAKF